MQAVMCLTQLEEQAKACSRGVTGEGWTLVVPIRIQNGCNLREHHMVRHRRVFKERQQVFYAILHAMKTRDLPMLKAPFIVTITRIAPRKLDSDNNVAGCKAVRDEIADWLDVDDGDESAVTWRYAQERAKGYAVRISIEEVGK